jgi:DNA-directed RNA polymerase specialized sigma24 family protein
MLSRWRSRLLRPAPSGPPAGRAPSRERSLCAGLPEACEGEARAYVFAMAGPLAAAADGACGTRHAAAYAEAVNLLETALANLPERTRQVFLRRQVNGEGEAALAAEYGVPPITIGREVVHAQHCVQCAMRG